MIRFKNFPIVLTLLILSYPKLTNTQQLIMGAGLTRTMASQNYKADGGGINIIAEYSAEDIYSLRSQFVYLMENSGRNEVLKGFDDRITSIDFSALYFPLSKKDYLFIGIGLGLYIHNPEQVGNTTFLNYDGIYGNKIKDNIGFILSGGVSTPATKLISLKIQIRYIYSNSKVTTTLLDDETLKEYSLETDLNLGGFFLDFDIAFRLWRY